MAMMRTDLENISSLADNETTPLNVMDLDQESLDWLTRIDTLSRGITDLEVPDPVDVEALIVDTLEEIENDRIDRVLRFLTSKLF